MGWGGEGGTKSTLRVVHHRGHGRVQQGSGTMCKAMREVD